MKKFISTLMAFLVSFQLTGIVSLADVVVGGTEDGSVSTDVVDVASIFIENAMATTEANETIVCYDIVNNTDSDMSLSGITGFYSTNGSLINLTSNDTFVAANSTSTVSVTSDTSAATIKIFLVDSSYAPLCASYEIICPDTEYSGSGAYMSYSAFSEDDGSTDININVLSVSRSVSFSTPYIGAESTIIMLTNAYMEEGLSSDNIIYIDQTSETGCLSGELYMEACDDGNYTLSFIGSDGSIMSANFDYTSQSDELTILDTVNNASNYMEIRDILEQYRDVIGIGEKYDALDEEGKVFVCKKLCGQSFTDIADLQYRVYEAIDDYSTSQETTPSQPSGGSSSGGGGGSIEGDNVVSVATVKGNAGETVCVDVMLNNGTGITSMGIEVDYDSSIMTLTGVQTYDVGATVTTANSLDVKPYHILFDSAQNFTYSGALATLTFEIAADAPTGEYPISVDYYKGLNGDYVDGDDINFDENFDPVALTYASGALKIYTPGDLNDDKKVTNKDATYMLRYLADWDIPDIVTVALDVNGDDCIDENDATHLLRYIAKWSNIVLY